jgi:hypothetical protein
MRFWRGVGGEEMGRRYEIRVWGGKGRAGEEADGER